MPAANDIRKGNVIKFNGEPHLVMETQHRTPGNLRAFVQIKMRNLRYGKSLDQRFASTDTLEVLPTDKRQLEFSYADRDTFAFIDPESFEQIELTAETLGDVKNYLTAGGKVDILFVDDKPLTVEIPSTVALKVTESADGIKGDLEYVSHHWQQTSFDVWEEVKAHHFDTETAQREALLEGAWLADEAHGRGIRTLANGAQYRGMFEMGKVG